MRTFRLAMAQINPTVGDLEGNTNAILRFIRKAQTCGADLVALPEMSLSGYPPEDLLFKPQFIQDGLRCLKHIVAETKGITAVIGYVDAHRGHLHNSAAVASDGKLVGNYNKIFLPNFGVFDEKRYFQPGWECPVFVINGAKVGVSICEDIWADLGPTELQRGAQAQLIVNINGSPYHEGKLAVRQRLLSKKASRNGVFVSYTNMVGGQDELVFDGGSMVLAPDGSLIALGCQFEEELVVVDLDLDIVDVPSEADIPIEQLSKVGEAHTVQVAKPEKNGSQQELIAHEHHASRSKEEEVYAALVLGTRDYVRKNGFHKTVIGLSGGIDSSLTAVIAVEALGKENVVGVSMPSRYSSEGSRKDAEVLAKNLGIEIEVIPIELAFGAYLNMLKERFEGTNHGTTEENLQARVRGVILMALSNKFGWLVLTTGNKSELATGYSTLYGDMAGGFAVIKDVPKTLVYELARYVNHINGKSVIPQAVINKPPSAELRPNQMDQDSLPPYETLDPILRAYVEEDQSISQIVKLGFDPEIVRQTINLVDRNEYKRRQGPPGVKITPRNFGRDRRMPIVNRYKQL